MKGQRRPERSRSVGQGQGQVDAILEYLGPLSMYALVQWAGFAVCMIPISYQMFAIVFTGKDVPQVCSPEASNSSLDQGQELWVLDSAELSHNATNTTSRRYNISFPFWDEGGGEQPVNSRRQQDRGHNSSSSSREVFPKDSSIMSDFDLVCDKAALVGLTQMLLGVGQFLGSLFLPAFADRVGRKRMHILTHALTGVSGVVVAFSPSFAVLAVSKAVVGMGIMGLRLTSTTAMLELFPARLRSLATAVVGGVLFALTSVTMAPVAFALRLQSWRLVQLTFTAATLLLPLQMLVLDEPVRALLAHNKREEALKVIQKAARWNKKDFRLLLEQFSSLLQPEGPPPPSPPSPPTTEDNGNHNASLDDNVNHNTSLDDNVNHNTSLDDNVNHNASLLDDNVNHNTSLDDNVNHKEKSSPNDTILQQQELSLQNPSTVLKPERSLQDDAIVGKHDDVQRGDIPVEERSHGPQRQTTVRGQGGSLQPDSSPGRHDLHQLGDIPAQEHEDVAQDVTLPTEQDDSLLSSIVDEMFKGDASPFQGVGLVDWEAECRAVSSGDGLEDGGESGPGGLMEEPARDAAVSQAGEAGDADTAPRACPPAPNIQGGVADAVARAGHQGGVLGEGQEEEGSRTEAGVKVRLGSEVKDPVRRVNILDILRHRRMRRHLFVACSLWLVTNMTYFGQYLISGSLAGDLYLNFALNGLVELPSALLYLFTLERFGRKWTLGSFQTLCGACLVISGLCRLFEDSSVAGLMSTVFFMTAKLGATAAVNVTIMYTGELFPTICRNQTIGIAAATGRVGIMIAPFFTTLAQHLPWAPGVVFGGLSLLSVCCLFLVPETTGRELPQTVQDLDSWYQDHADPDLHPDPDHDPGKLL